MAEHKEMSPMGVALVTGGGRRVGAAICRELATRGSRVAIHYHRSDEGARALADEIQQAGGEAEIFQADLYSRGEAAGLIEKVSELFGGIDLLVPSAANFDRLPVDKITDEAWDRALDLNLTAPMALARAALPTLRERGGNIVFITCASTVAPYRHYLPYQVSKAGLKQLMRALAIELAPQVRVNAVAPGTVMPPEGMSVDAIEELRKKSPLGRIGSAEGVARAVAYLAQAPWVTGQELLVDGGAALVGADDY